MSRVRELSRHTAWFQALALLFLSGCIFSPEQKTPEPIKQPEIKKPEDVIGTLKYAYQVMNSKVFVSILANQPERGNAAYLFFLSEPTDLGETNWGYTEEARIHQRMLDPEDTPAGDPPVPPERWLSSISINLTQLTPFQERTDLYSTSVPVGADGKLDPAIWIARDSRYGTDVFFDTQGENDFQVTGEANFVVIEDKTKQVGDSGKFLLYIWEDLLTTPKPQAGERPI
jgi:hypothetical protein